jgi:hypothetical protein
MNRRGRYRNRGNVSGSSRGNGTSGAHHGRDTSTDNAHARTTTRGLFADGVWHCDCTPRLPAEHFPVKKKGPNKGRWFYTCQLKERNKRCGFFLWDAEAKPREAAAVLGNSRSEPGAKSLRGDVQPAKEELAELAKKSTSVRPTALPTGRGMFAGTGRRVSLADLDGSPTPTPSPSPPRDTRSPGKRSAHNAGLDDFEDDDFGWTLSAGEESELARIADAVETPRKAIKTGVYATPATTTTKKSTRKLPWIDDEPPSPIPFRRGLEPKSPKSPKSARTIDEPVTPTTTRTRRTVLDYFMQQPAKSGSVSPTSSITDHSAEGRTTFVEDSFPQIDAATSAARPRVHFTPLNEPKTPPARLQEDDTTKSREPNNLPTTPAAQTATAPTTPATPAPLPLSTTLLPLLTSLPESSLAEVRTLLTTHDLRVQGIVMGREIARAAAKARDQKIEELERELRGFRN